MTNKKRATLDYNPEFGLKEITEEWVSKAILYHKGNMAQTARALKISRAALYRFTKRVGAKLKKQGLKE